MLSNQFIFFLDKQQNINILYLEKSVKYIQSYQFLWLAARHWIF